ncbi:secernin-2 [Lingula anatina]|uniref:Secernin-2 n=1 Tax=Lingula anatina TaxID=7574 RepID=A0A1S3ILK4_LINAN|nr:secernin-2 [Lingula anatina]|eukprot:XP_013399097.1 secernin-2 [Lingula anatina]
MAEDLASLSCDSFVALPPATRDGLIIYGKNSDRPRSEVQEFIYCPAADHAEGTKLKCTYIEIDQVAHTHAVALSKPAWMWGAEMGANEHGVCIGNEAVFTKLQGPDDSTERLLGMDLVRLGLERAASAEAAMKVVSGLLEQYGQGGMCFEDPDHQNFTYHNSFLIVDRTEAWVLETAGQLWAAKKVTSGVHNISNLLTIGTEIDAMSAGLKEHAEKNGYWKPEDGPLDFAKAYAIPPTIPLPPIAEPQRRLTCGKELMEKYAEGGNFSLSSMFQVLKDEDSGICAVREKIITAGSMVSVLTPPSATIPCTHWFTATPFPDKSFFKPFVFCPDIKLGELTKSPDYGDKDPARQSPRFQETVDRVHKLYASHALGLKKSAKDLESRLSLLHQLQEECIEGVEEFLQDYKPEKSSELTDLFQNCVESELILWK